MTEFVPTFLLSRMCALLPRIGVLTNWHSSVAVTDCSLLFAYNFRSSLFDKSPALTVGMSLATVCPQVPFLLRLAWVYSEPL
jgi:hypothetical protein